MSKIREVFEKHSGTGYMDEDQFRAALEEIVPSEEEIEKMFYVNEDRMSNGDHDRLLKQGAAKWLRSRILGEITKE